MNQSKLALIWYAVLLTVAVSMPIAALALQDEQIPERVDFVSDYADILQEDVEQDLNRLLAETQSDVGLSLNVLVISTTGGVSIDQYGNQVFAAWGIDKEDQAETSFLFLLAIDDGLYQLMKSAGLEEELPDDKLEQISEEVIMPQFIEQNFEGGIVGGVAQVIQLYSDAQKSAPVVHRSSGANRVLGVDVLGIVMILAGVALLLLIQSLIG